MIKWRNLPVCVVFTLIYISVFYPVYASQVDSVLVQKLLQKGDSLTLKAGYVEAEKTYIQALNQLENFTNASLTLHARNGITKALFGQSKLKEAEVVVDHSLELIKSNNLPPSDQVAKTYKLRGILHAVMSNADEGRKFMQKAVNILEEIGETGHREYASTILAIGTSYFDDKKSELALQYYVKARDLMERDEEEVPENLITLYTNIGSVYQLMNQTQRASNELEKALKLAKTHGLENMPVIGLAYNALGAISITLGRWEQALLHYQKAKEIMLLALGNAHYYVSFPYINMGMVYHMIGDYDESIKNYNEAIKIRLAVFGEKHVSLVDSYYTLSWRYEQMNDFPLALEYAEKSRAMSIELFGENHVWTAKSYFVLMKAYRGLGLFEEAFKTGNKIIKIFERLGINDNSNLATFAKVLGDLYSEHQKFDSAIVYYQKCINASLFSYEQNDPFAAPNLTNYINGYNLLDGLAGKGNAFRNKAVSELDTSYLHASLANFQWCDSLIGIIRNSFQSQEDKLSLADLGAKAYHGGVETCLALYKATSDVKYIEQALYFSEKNKSAILYGTINDQTAKKYGLIPQELTQLESELKSMDSYYHSRLQEAEINDDTLAINLFSNKRLVNYKRIDSLVQAMENQYPEYYHLKYQSEKFDLNKINQHLGAGEVLIEYFSTSKDLYAFVVQKGTIDVVDLGAYEIIKQEVAEFRQSMLSKNANEKFKNWTQASFSLYSKLFKPIEQYLDGDANHLIIIPDAALHYVPFEAFISSMPDEGQMNFVDLSYLIRQFQMSYGYSASLTFLDLQSLSGGSGYLLFAPSYSSEISTDSLARLEKTVFRDAISPLLWNQQEVKEISKMVGGEYFVSQDATEGHFKSISQDYQILHLAMHALIDDKDPMNSKFVFSEQSDTLEDGYLHAFEVYNMRLNADLAVLSACNTGTGNISNGEGAMSLARAFRYAGVSNLVMSLWQVSDQTTSLLMNNFYGEIDEGNSYSMALREAKLDYLENSDRITADPFYWAAFTYRGSPKDSLKKSFFDYRIVLVSFFLILLMGILGLKKWRS